MDLARTRAGDENRTRVTCLEGRNLSHSATPAGVPGRTGIGLGPDLGRALGVVPGQPGRHEIRGVDAPGLPGGALLTRCHWAAVFQDFPASCRSGAGGDRILGLLLFRQPLYQLSYSSMSWGGGRTRTPPRYPCRGFLPFSRDGQI